MTGVIHVFEVEYYTWSDGAENGIREKLITSVWETRSLQPYCGVAVATIVTVMRSWIIPGMHNYW